MMCWAALSSLRTWMSGDVGQRECAQRSGGTAPHAGARQRHRSVGSACGQAAPTWQANAYAPPPLGAVVQRAHRRAMDMRACRMLSGSHGASAHLAPAAPRSHLGRPRDPSWGPPLRGPPAPPRPPALRGIIGEVAAVGFQCMVGTQSAHTAWRAWQVPCWDWIYLSAYRPIGHHLSVIRHTHGHACLDTVHIHTCSSVVGCCNTRCVMALHAPACSPGARAHHPRPRRRVPGHHHHRRRHRCNPAGRRPRAPAPAACQRSGPTPHHRLLPPRPRCLCLRLRQRACCWDA